MKDDLPQGHRRDVTVGQGGATGELRCERCDFVIGLGCACPPDGSAPKEHPTTSAQQEWRHFPSDTILISPTRYAHLPGACAHLTEELVTAPRWGWIPTPPAGLWDRLSSSHPATATQGNTERRAVRRCGECQTATM
ncbi:hypothetical protein [Streptomyces bobili]|jgi:hypothetical protein|uniref:hypothetical protein n=1 Tax=Streptomyces bobili TaxID=67280 RepID=UPI001ABF5BFD|nr:hypothetical protein [Streptomyces bobili]